VLKWSSGISGGPCPFAHRSAERYNHLIYLLKAYDVVQLAVALRRSQSPAFHDLALSFDM
jgi:hypothetical protein